MRCELHSRLGAAFEAFLLSTQAAELAVLAAVHQNATPLPKELATRTRRCDVNLRAAEVAAQAADFAQTLTFLDVAKELLHPDIWADHARAMRLCLQRARTFGAMLRHAESLDFAQQAIRHARNLIEEGQALLLAIGALTQLGRYGEAVDVCVDFWNRLDPQANLPKHPGPASVVVDIIRITLAVQRAGAAAFLLRLNEPEDPKRDLVYDLIAAVTDAVYLGRPMLNAKLARHGMESLLHQGASLRCRGSAIHMVTIGAAMLSLVGKFELAIEMGKAVRRSLDAVPLETRGRFLFLIESFVRHLDEPLRTPVQPYLTAASYCRQARAPWYEGYALAMGAMALDCLGEPIDQMKDVYAKLTSEPAVASSQEILDWIPLRRCLHAALQGQGDPAAQLAAGAGRSTTIRAIRSAVKLRGAAFGVWPRPYRWAEYGFPMLLSISMGLGGSYMEGIEHFEAGIVYLTALRGELPLLDRLHFKAAAALVTAKVQARARHNPADYAHRIALLEAEQLRNRGKLELAVPLYEKAARLAQENSWLNEAALVLEKLTEVLAELGDRERARRAASESTALYRRWQAWAKVEQLERVAAVLRN